MSLATQTYRGFGALGSFDAYVRRGFAAYTALPQPPATYQYETCTSASWTGTSLSQGSSPAVAVGDVFIASVLSSPSSFPITVNGDGTLDENAAGNTSRQEILYGIYRVAANAIDPSGFPSTTGKFWINEIGPTWNIPIVLNLTVGVAMTPINLGAVNPYVFSPEGDAMVFSQATNWLPGGITLSSSGLLAGIPSGAIVATGQINAVDSTGTIGTSATCQITVISAPGPAGPFIVQALTPGAYLRVAYNPGDEFTLH
jgi:hypothetical protein